MSLSIEKYCVEHSTRRSALAAELEAFTRQAIPGSRMLIGELEASLLRLLIQAAGVRRILELGTFTGYSALCMAEALPADGQLITVDVNSGTTEIARRFWERSPHGHKITAVLRPGTEFLPTVNETFDLVFIDADKVNYPFYVRWAREHLSATGLLVMDNVIWSGKVIEAEQDEHTKAIVAASDAVASWEDFITSLLPVRDGMLLARRRS